MGFLFLVSHPSLNGTCDTFVVSLRKKKYFMRMETLKECSFFLAIIVLLVHVD